MDKDIFEAVMKHLPIPEIFAERLDGCGVPYHMREAFTAYVYQGRPPGHFLWAVLENDLMQAFARADDKNQVAMVSFCKVLYHIPGCLHGSREKVNAWLVAHAEERKRRAES